MRCWKRFSRPTRQARLLPNRISVSRLAQFDRFFVWEVGGDFLGDFAGGGPFGSALEGGAEAAAFLWGEVGAVVVAERGVEGAAFAIVANEEEGFVFAGAGLFFGGKSAGEDGEVLRRAAEAVLEFVLGVHPFFGQPAHDGWPGVR